jgi:hypothetical protein
MAHYFKKLHDYVKSKGFGIYEIVLKPEYYFKLGDNPSRIYVGVNEGQINQLEERTISSHLWKDSNPDNSHTKFDINSEYDTIIFRIYGHLKSIIPCSSIMKLSKQKVLLCLTVPN